MTVAASAPKAPRPLNFRPHKRASVVAGIAAVAVAGALIVNPPNLGLLLAAPLIVQVHVYAAIAAFILGAVILLARKGRRFHITAGWVWVALMATAAVVSLFITGINGKWWSFIHIFSGTTLLMLPLAIRAVRKRSLSAHRKIMLSVYFGGMVVAGGFTFLPGRLMYGVFIGG